MSSKPAMLVACSLNIRYSLLASGLRLAEAHCLQVEQQVVSGIEQLQCAGHVESPTFRSEVARYFLACHLCANQHAQSFLRALVPT